jgi:hypothetical protein
MTRVGQTGRADGDAVATLGQIGERSFQSILAPFLQPTINPARCGSRARSARDGRHVDVVDTERRQRIEDCVDEQRRDDGIDDPIIEIVDGNGKTGMADWRCHHALAAPGKADHREIAGAAAKIGDQDQRVGLEPLGIVVDRADRLVDKSRVGDPDTAIGLAVTPGREPSYRIQSASNEVRPDALRMPERLHLCAGLRLVHAQHIPVIPIKERGDPVVCGAVDVHGNVLQLFHHRAEPIKVLISRLLKTTGI